MGLIYYDFGRNGNRKPLFTAGRPLGLCCRRTERRMKTIKVGLIGTGYIGMVHLEMLRRLGGVEVVAVADTNKDLARRRPRNSASHGSMTSADALIADREVEVIHNCAPNNVHFDINAKAIRAGKEVLSEKPLALDSRESAELLELAEKHGTLTAINFCYRYYPVVQEAAARARRGDLGDVRAFVGPFPPGLALLRDGLLLAPGPQGRGQGQRRRRPRQPLVRPRPVHHRAEDRRGHGRAPHLPAQAAQAQGGTAVVRRRAGGRIRGGRPSSSTTMPRSFSSSRTEPGGTSRPARPRPAARSTSRSRSSARRNPMPGATSTPTPSGSGTGKRPTRFSTNPRSSRPRRHGSTPPCPRAIPWATTTPCSTCSGIIMKPWRPSGPGSRTGRPSPISGPATR